MGPQVTFNIKRQKRIGWGMAYKGGIRFIQFFWSLIKLSKDGLLTNGTIYWSTNPINRMSKSGFSSLAGLPYLARIFVNL